MPGAWYWASSRATTRSTFGSLVWSKGDDVPFPGIGEVARHGWRDGSVLPCVSLLCGGCTGATPGSWSLSPTGFGNGAFNTSLLNGSWTLPSTTTGPSLCAWSDIPVPAPGQTKEVISFVAETPPTSPTYSVSLGVWTQTGGGVFRFSAAYRYTLAGPPSTCLLPLTLGSPVLVPSTVDATPYAHPATITLTPHP